MHLRPLGSGLGALVLGLALSACGGSPVTIKTLDPGSQEGCYLSGIEGTLVTDPDAGTAILSGMPGGRTIVTWPRGWTGRTSGSEVEIINRQGVTAYRTGTRVSLSGGFSYVDRSFVVCGLELINP